MHPAYSVILFTTASGAGLGLLAWLALLGMLDAVPADRWLGVVGLGLAFVLVAGGLIASTAHLGRPERAWRAFSQWRTSWLSREGVMAVATTVPAGMLGVGWVGLESVDGLFALPRRRRLRGFHLYSRA
jgi:DMSO reductase anchor subunit